eukprot:TRINITY_DN8931_c0_g1_i14.p4 TRINITY_DN8931_c0_g1~~TRINITY_DN8931_c0_g1_i14.p4  ORF type:complete len:154 (+),score=43.14 TRINITY_DN8931_c0_g1_i14:121-582(+)
MIRNLTLVSWLAACLVTATSVFGQMGPPDPADVAARCVASMEAASDRTVGAIGDTTGAAVDRIARLDAAGAPDRAIIRAGEDGIKRVRLIGRFGSARITNIERHCVRLLVRLEAERDLIARVRDAADGFREDVRNAVQRGSGAIRQAVADAIG